MAWYVVIRLRAAGFSFSAWSAASRYSRMPWAISPRARCASPSVAFRTKLVEANGSSNRIASAALPDIARTYAALFTTVRSCGNLVSAKVCNLLGFPPSF